MLEQNCIHLRFAVETMGPWCHDAIKFINTLGKLLRTKTEERRTTFNLKQRKKRTFSDSQLLDEISYIL